jgi:anti-anti-sigma factor
LAPAGEPRARSARSAVPHPERKRSFRSAYPIGPLRRLPLEIMASPISVTLAPRDPPAAVVALVGEHDAYSSQRLEQELGLLLDEGLRVVVDLRDTEFIDSTTLSVLLGARLRAERARLGFTIVLPPREFTQVRQILELTRLGSAFASYGKLDDALTAARSGKTSGSVRSAA